MELIEKKMKAKQSNRHDRNAKNREIIDFSKSQRAHQNCKTCFYNQKRDNDSFMDVRVGESQHWLILYPQSIRPLSPMGAPEPITHFQLVPKEHYGSTLELDEDVARDLQSLKKTLVRYWNS